MGKVLFKWIFNLFISLTVSQFVAGNDIYFPYSSEDKNNSGNYYQNETDTVKNESGDTLSKFDKFNKKAEHFFKIFPVPIVSYNPEAGSIFGLAKFNAFRLDSRDTISGFSKVSEVFTVSTKGFVNFSATTTLVFSQDKYMVIGFVNYKKTPEYLFGIGNDIHRDDMEMVTSQRFKFSNIFLRKFISSLYIGVGVDLTNTYEVSKDSTSFLNEEDVTGSEGGFETGFGLSTAWDTRDNRYNAAQGSYLILSYLFYPNWAGDFGDFHRWKFDARKFYNPWYKHVIAVQFATNYVLGDVPYYELTKLGGDSRMRGYYEGAYRDYTLLDCQLEYRMPVWNIFGVVGWIGMGQVAHSYQDIAWSEFLPTYGIGFRIKVDSESDINMRIDLGFGNQGIHGVYLNFGEAF